MSLTELTAHNIVIHAGMANVNITLLWMWPAGSSPFWPSSSRRVVLVALLDDNDDDDDADDDGDDDDTDDELDSLVSTILWKKSSHRHFTNILRLWKWLDK